MTRLPARPIRVALVPVLLVAAGGLAAATALPGTGLGPRSVLTRGWNWVEHLATRDRPAYVEAGRRTYVWQCATCHGPSETDAVRLAHRAFARAGDRAVFRQIADAPGLDDMPAFAGRLGDREILATVAYLRARSGEPAPASPAAGALPDGRYEYVAHEGGVTIYDTGAGFEPVRRIRIPRLRNLRGIAASVEAGLLYLSFHPAEGEPDADDRSGRLLAIDLARSRPEWSREIRPGIDSFAVTPDGRKIYMPVGEGLASQTECLVLDARDGAELARVPVAPAPHNTIVSPDGTRAYLGAIGSNHLGVIDTRTDHLIARIGPFGERIRPFALTGDGRYALVNVNFLSGFEVADLVAGKALHRVEVEGWPWVDPPLPATQSHGVAFDPDEREAWVCDAWNRRLQIFDVSALPARPRYLGSVAVDPPDAPAGEDRLSLPKWVRLTRDGRWVRVSNGAVVDAATREVVRWILPSRYFIEVHWRAGRPAAAFSRYGNGYRGAPAPPG